MLKFGDAVLKDGNKWLTTPLPPIPLNTLRVRVNDNNPPNHGEYTYARRVTGTNDIYDVYKSGDSFRMILKYSTNVIEVLGANTTGITNMSNMFLSCYSLTKVALFDTSNVIRMIGMFASCTSLTSVPLFDMSSAIDIGDMFNNCPSLTSVPLFDTSNVTDMSLMFRKCSSLTSVPLFDTSNVTDMGGMFEECTSLTTVPLFDTSSVTNMFDMFFDCTSLTSIPLFNTSNVTDITQAFYNCTNVESGALALYQQMSTQANPPSHRMCFTDCGVNTVTGAAELAQIPSGWK